ncbi:MAG: hypothetical protein MZV70_69725 [Desulfobacterales bacterium]|nr:hypothetical protein [Desulfobacterales bacterium]
MPAYDLVEYGEGGPVASVGAGGSGRFAKTIKSRRSPSRCRLHADPARRAPGAARRNRKEPGMMGTRLDGRPRASAARMMLSSAGLRPAALAALAALAAGSAVLGSCVSDGAGTARAAPAEAGLRPPLPPRRRYPPGRRTSRSPRRPPSGPCPAPVPGGFGPEARVRTGDRPGLAQGRRDPADRGLRPGPALGCPGRPEPRGDGRERRAHRRLLALRAGLREGPAGGRVPGRDGGRLGSRRRCPAGLRSPGRGLPGLVPRRIRPGGVPFRRPDPRPCLAGPRDGRGTRVRPGRSPLRAAWLRSGKELVLGGAAGALVLWKAGEPAAWTLGPSSAAGTGPAGESPAVRALAVSPDGTRAAAARADGSVVVRDIASGAVLVRFPAHRGAALSVAWSPDGLRLATGGRTSRSGSGRPRTARPMPCSTTTPCRCGA